MSLFTRSLLTTSRISISPRYLAIVGATVSATFLPHAASAADTCPIPSYGTAHPSPAPLRAEGNYFKDSAGRVVLLRGVNATGDAKVPPFKTLQDPAKLAPLPGWGINTVRLLFTWEAFEPTRCNYDNSYLNYYEQVVSQAEALGLNVIIDFHQDAFSRYSLGGCGEGFPSWAVHSSIALKTPKNDSSCSGWGANMIFDTSHHATWSEFHKDSEGAKTRYVAMVKAVADRMSTHRNVIGYELINEPWGNDTELYNLYEAAGAAIRDRDPERILFVPPHALVSSGTPNNNIPRQTFNNIVYSPHFYDGSVVTLGVWFGNSPSGSLNKMLNKAKSWNAPMLLGEYGANHTVSNVANYMESLYSWLDANFVSGTQWNYTPGWTSSKKDGWNDENLSIVDGSGNLRTKLFTPRAYPQITAGTPVSFKRNSKGFTYSWNNETAKGQTDIFLPAGYSTGKYINYNGTQASISCSINGQKMSCIGMQSGLASVTLTAP
jgi:endoglycosylceramidase